MIKRAVLDFLEALGPELRRQALFAFESEERRNWHHIRRARKGVLLKYMSEPQRRAAKALLQAGLRVRGAEEDHGRQLIRGLHEEQRATALIAAVAFEDIITGPSREDSLRQPIGVTLGMMDEEHRDLAMRIIEEFIGTMRPAAA